MMGASVGVGIGQTGQPSGDAVEAPPAAPGFIAAPSLSAPSMEAGALLTIDPGQASGSPAPSLTLTLLRDGTPVIGPIAPPFPATYQTTATDAGAVFRLEVAAQNTSGAITEQTSVTMIAPTAAPELARAPALAWNGTIAQLTPAQFTGAPAPSVENAWTFDGQSLGDLGAAHDFAGYPAEGAVQVTQTAANAHGQAIGVSNIITTPDVATAPPAILTPARITISADNPDYVIGVPASFSGANLVTGQWLADGAAIEGATAAVLDASAYNGAALTYISEASGAGGAALSASDPVTFNARPEIPLGSAVIASSNDEYRLFISAGQSNTKGGDFVESADRAWTPGTFGVLSSPSDGAFDGQVVRLVEPLEGEGAATSPIGHAKSFADAYVTHEAARAHRRAPLMMRAGWSGSGITTNRLVGPLQGFNAAAMGWAGVSEWTPGEAYQAGHIVHNAGYLYDVSADHTAPGAFDGANLNLRPATGNWIAGVGDLRNSLLNRIADARAAAPNARLGGLLWMQGESEATRLSGAEWAAFWDAWFTDLRAELGAPDLPIIIGGIAPSWQRGDAQVQDLKAAMAATPARLAFSGYADPSTLSIYESPNYDAAELGFDDEPEGEPSDGIHYGRASQARFGRRFLAGYLNALSNGQPGASAQPSAPAAIADLAAAGGQGEIALTWTRPDNGGGVLLDYELERSADGAAWALITPGPIAEGFTLGGLGASETVHFRIRAIGEGGAAAWSGVVSATTSAGFDASIGRLNLLTIGAGGPAVDDGAAVTFSGATVASAETSGGFVARSAGGTQSVRFDLAPTADFTYAMWCKPANLGVINGIMAENSAADFVFWNTPVTDQARLWAGIGGSGNILKGKLPQADLEARWVHFVMTYDDSAQMLRQYVGGALHKEASTAGYARALAPSVTFTTGYAASGVAKNSAFRGDILRVQRWGAAMSGAEVAAMFADEAAALFEPAAVIYLDPRGAP